MRAALTAALLLGCWGLPADPQVGEWQSPGVGFLGAEAAPRGRGGRLGVPCKLLGAHWAGDEVCSPRRVLASQGVRSAAPASRTSLLAPLPRRCLAFAPPPVCPLSLPLPRSPAGTPSGLGARGGDSAPVPRCPRGRCLSSGVPDQGGPQRVSRVRPGLGSLVALLGGVRAGVRASSVTAPGAGFLPSR